MRPTRARAVRSLSAIAALIAARSARAQTYDPVTQTTYVVPSNILSGIGATHHGLFAIFGTTVSGVHQYRPNYLRDSVDGLAKSLTGALYFGARRQLFELSMDHLAVDSMLFGQAGFRRTRVALGAYERVASDSAFTQDRYRLFAVDERPGRLMRSARGVGIEITGRTTDQPQEISTSYTYYLGNGQIWEFNTNFELGRATVRDHATIFSAGVALSGAWNQPPLPRPSASADVLGVPPREPMFASWTSGFSAGADFELRNSPMFPLVVGVQYQGSLIGHSWKSRSTHQLVFRVVTAAGGSPF